MAKVIDLVLLAGPSCCGKSHFLEHVSGGHSDHVLKAALSAHYSSYRTLTPKELPSLGDELIPGMILHLALPIIPLVEGSLRQVSDDNRLQLVKSSERVTAITMLASRGVLMSRLRKRERAGLKQLFRGISQYRAVHRRLSKLKEIYGSSAGLIAVYEAWFHYLQSLDNLDAEWLLTCDDQYELLEPSEWPRIKNAYFPEHHDPPAA